MALYPGALLGNIKPQFFDADGAPVALGKLYSYIAGTTTPQDTFTSSDLDPMSANTNPIVLDAAGRPTDPVYLSPIGYKFTLTDADDVPLWTVDDVEDNGQVFANAWGTLLGDGVSYSDGETILVTTRLALVDSSSGATTVYLPASADATQPLCVKNMGGNAVTVTADGTDTLESALSSVTIPAAATPTFPAIEIAPNGIAGWFIRSSHGL